MIYCKNNKEGLSYFGRLKDGEVHFCVEGCIANGIFHRLKCNHIKLNPVKRSKTGSRCTAGAITKWCTGFFVVGLLLVLGCG
jgi:hypothetical protein